MPEYPRTLVGAIEELSRNFGVSFEKIDRSLDAISSAIKQPLAVYQGAVSEPREEVLLCYTVGTLEFVPFRHNGEEERYGLLDMGLYTLEGDLNGRYQVIWQPDSTVPPQQIYERPPEYTGPWDRVVEPIPAPMLRANSNAYYRFDREGGTIFATGPANLLLTPLKDGSQMFQISVCTYITGGNGVFHGCSGVNTALGSSFVPKGLDVLRVPDHQKVPGVTVSTFRLVRAQSIGHPPQAH
jgi:hypothetical protein